MQFFNSVKQHIQSAMILRNNPNLLYLYNQGPMYLYTLHTQQYPNQQVQDDYNKLHPDYKYNRTLDNGMPFSILLADPKYIRHLQINASRF
jgi:hypothetical protein